MKQMKNGVFGALAASLILLLSFVATAPSAAAYGPGKGAVAAGPSNDGGDEGEAVKVRVVANRSEVVPGGRLVIAVIFDHAPGYHIHTNDPQVPKDWDFVPIATDVKLVPPAGFKQGRTQWPKTETVMADLAGTGKLEAYGVFGGHAVVYLPLTVDAGAASGERELMVKLTYQACNATVCQGPVDETIKVKVMVGSKTTEAANQAEFAGLGVGIFEQSTEVEEEIVFSIFGTTLKLNPHGAVGMGLLLLAAMLGGFLLNLTPCVLPVIPIKMMGLNHAAGTRRRQLLLGAMMSLGVIAFWLGIGAAISLVTGFTAVNQLFQNSWFSIGIGVFIALMAVGMFGAFTVQLPQWVYAVDPKRDTVAGSLVFGVMTAVLSTPCTAPFGGAAMAWATKQDIGVTLLTFGAIGAGMAVPYMALAAFPKLVKGVPKAGPGSDLLKQVLGLLMIAVAVFFVGVGLDPKLREPVDPAIRFHWWIMAAVVVGAMAWMVYRLARIKVRAGTRLVLSVLGIALAVGMVVVAKSVTDLGPIKWVGYTPEREAQALKEGKVIVIDFTAEWCLNCKSLEAAVLHREEVVKALNDPSVAAFRVDLTGENPAGKAKLKSLSWVGIPLLAISGPGAQEPAKFDTYTVQVVLDAMGKAGFKRQMSGVAAK